MPPNRKTRFRRKPLGPYRYVRLHWRMLFTVVDTLGAIAFRTAPALKNACLSARRILAAHKPKLAEGSEDPRTILLIQLDHLGDAIVSTGMFPALRRRYANASIEVLAGPWNREVFEALPEVDRVHVSRLNRFAQNSRLGWTLATLWWGWRLRRRKVDLVIDVRGEFPHALIAWLSGAQRRLGWNSGGGGFLLTDSPRFVPDRPETESRLALLAELGIRPSGGENWRPMFPVNERPAKSVDRRLASLCPDGSTDGPLLVVHVGAGTPAKRWPAKHWRELIGRVVVELDAKVVLVGGPGDSAIARQVLQDRIWPIVGDWTGELDVSELAALIQRADLLVGCDSGPAHLAAAVGTPVVVLFSGTNNPRQWQPRGDRVTVVRHPVDCSPCHRRKCAFAEHPCMARIAPGVVAEAVGRSICPAPHEERRKPMHVITEFEDDCPVS